MKQTERTLGWLAAGAIAFGAIAFGAIGARAVPGTMTQAFRPALAGHDGTKSRARSIVEDAVDVSSDMVSAHIVGALRVLESDKGTPIFSANLRFRGGVSSQPVALRVILFSPRGEKPGSDITLVETEREVAQKVLRQKWECARVTKTTPNSLQDFASLMGFLAEPTTGDSFRIQGARKYGGGRAWVIAARLRGVPARLLSLPALPHHARLSLAAILVIGQQTHLLRSVKLAAGEKGGSTVIRMALNVSFYKYDKAARVLLPTACGARS